MEDNTVLNQNDNVEVPQEVPSMRERWIRVLKCLLRILIGAFFITTAVLKLFSLDEFEIYIYSFQIFSFTLSTVVARLIIMMELLLGLFLMVKILYKPVWWLAMAMLAGFTLLLVYVALFRHDSNCHCMGEIVQLNPVLSIVKNLVTMALLLLVRKENDYHFKGKVLVGVLGAVAAIIVPFVLFPMDTVWSLLDKKGLEINENRFEDFMQDSLALAQQFDDNRYVVAFIASGCEYCKISGKKLNSIVENHHLDTNRVVFFIWGEREGIEAYKKETGATHFRYVPVNPITAVEVVNGMFPTFIFLEEGHKTKAVNIRGLTESDVVYYLSQAE